jgi:aminoglycoside 6'-N-acetyltransferase
MLMSGGTSSSIYPALNKNMGRASMALMPTHVLIVEQETRPIGWIQWYRWSDYPTHAARLEAEPNAAGIDLAIGEASEIGKGIGSSAIRQFILNVVATEPGITAIVTDPEDRNGRSCRAFGKAGFIAVRTVELEGENVRRRIMHLSLPASMSQPLKDR